MIYIHIPFCLRKCLYCDFYSISDASLYEAYIDAVVNEIKEHSGKTVETVYIGGGTPTVIGDGLKKIVKAVTDCFYLSDNYEFTVETNPGTSDAFLIKEIAQMGVNRISLGAQSFVDSELKTLGRIHTSKDIFKTVDVIRNAGINNLSLDLMFGIPEQTMETLKNSLECVLSLNPEHVSAYSLILEEGTPFYNMDLSFPSEDTEREMYYYINDTLEANDIFRYEISNYAKKGYESKHNTRYWKDYEYIGIGAGAHSYNNRMRYNNICDVQKYINDSERKENVINISEKERNLELFMLGLRLKEGIIYNGEYPQRVNPLIEKGLLELSGKNLRLTPRGTDLANLVFMEFTDD